jgi:hypothetical protein
MKYIISLLLFFGYASNAFAQSWSPKDPKLKKSYNAFVSARKSNRNVGRLSLVALKNAMKFFENNHKQIQNLRFIRKAENIGKGPRYPNTNHIANKRYIVIVDYTISRYQKRFFLLDLRKNKIFADYAAHGYGSNSNGKKQLKPTRFSNIKNSGKTSLGYYLTAEYYCSDSNTFGDCRHAEDINGLILDGITMGNWRARDRWVVYHGATYVKKGKGATGNSAGCPSTTLGFFDQHYDKMNNGMLMYIYSNL